MTSVWPKIGDVWKAPIDHDVYLVVDIAHGSAWAILLTGSTLELRRFGLIGSAWMRVIAGEES